MYRTLAVLVALGLASLARADDAKAPPAKGDDVKKETQPVLKVGDPAPPLRATKWLQGEEVKAFAPGRTYVVEFWATWCGPCIVMMPHLGELQAEYRDKGLTIIGFSPQDRTNTEEKVIEFVKKRGPKLGYTFAYADDRETYDAWMKAAKRSGIPCSFVVDQKGRVAYIGHPMYLDEVLPKVVAGTWNTEDVAEVGALEKEMSDAFRAVRDPDPEAGLKALAAFEARRPGLAKVPYLVGPKLDLLLRLKRTDEARAMADALVSRAIAQEDRGALQTVWGTLARSPAGKDRPFAELCLKAAEANLKIAGEDVSALLMLARTHFAAGDRTQAREVGARAVAAARSPAERQAVENAVKQFEDDKGDKDGKDK